MGDEEQQAVVIDNGTGFIKAGFAGDDAPRCAFPNIIGCDKKCEADFYVGDEAIKKLGNVTMTYPMNKGMTFKWDEMEKIWHYTYNQLHTAPEERPVLLTEGSMSVSSRSIREKMTQIMLRLSMFPPCTWNYQLFFLFMNLVVPLASLLRVVMV